MRNIYLIPTDKDSLLFIGDLSGELHFNYSIERGNSVNQHIYITSDEKIKKGDYWIYVCPINGIDYGDDNNPIVKNNLNHTWFEKLHDKNNYKKIIMTTDQDLIKDAVQEIPDEFLEWFVKNHTCKFVEVKQLLSNNGNAFFGYKIILPKEKQKQLLSEMMQEDEKSGLYDETIEQAAKNYRNSTVNTMYIEQGAFEECAKWQQKQMYSKQQVLELMKQAFEAGFKKSDTVESGLEPKETEQEINWILIKQNNK